MSTFIERIRNAIAGFRNPNHVCYICDRKQCKDCNPECEFTTDVRHAVNFIKVLNGFYQEKERL